MKALAPLGKLSSASDVGVDSSQLGRKINKSHRNSVLKWLFESLDLLRVEDSVFFGTVSLSDRYCARTGLSRRLEGADLQLVILASLCCCLKIVESSVDLSVKAFLEHVSGGHVESKDIFQTEAKILRAIDFDAFVPAHSEYVTTFFNMLCRKPLPADAPLEEESARPAIPEWARKQRDMAMFLLYLLSLDVDRLHAMSAPKLAASCILTGVWIVKTFDKSAASNDGPDVQDIAKNLIACSWIETSADIHRMIEDTTLFWEGCVNKQSEATQSLVRIFASPQRSCVSSLLPPVSARTMAGGG
jgi:hypothetical protein